MNTETIIVIAGIWCIPVMCWSSKYFAPAAKLWSTYFAIIITGGIWLWT